MYYDVLRGCVVNFAVDGILANTSEIDNPRLAMLRDSFKGIFEDVVKVYGCFYLAMRCKSKR